MKKIIWILIVFWWIWFLGYALYAWKKNLDVENSKQTKVENNFLAVKNYLIKNYKWNYPIPSWNIILLDKTKMMIHLSDRNTPLSKIKKLYVIQWTTCDILKNDKEFQKINYDPIHSIKSGNKIIFKRCFTYSVTADRKNFQIGTIKTINGKAQAQLVWTIDESITRSYSSPRLVKNGGFVDLPYPAKVSPVVIVHNLWNQKLQARVENLLLWETKNINLHEGVNYLLSDIGKYNIKILWIVKNPLTKIDFVDVDGDLIHLQGNSKNHLLSFEVKDYQLKWKKKNYFIQTGKFLAEVLKLSPDTNMTVSHNWTTLVIRGTKFTVEADKNDFDTFLSLGHIIQIVWWKQIDLTLQHAFSLIKDSKLVENLKKIKKLVSFSVLSDVINNPKWKYEIKNNPLTSILTGIQSIKRFNIDYDNWQKITLVKVDLSSWSNKFDKILKENKNRLWLSKIMQTIEKDNGRWSDRLYKNLVSSVCKSTNSLRWLDVSKLWYLLSEDKNIIWKLDLKSDIADSIWLNKNFVILTSRHYNGQNSVVIWYDSNDKLWVRTINLKWLNYDDNVNTVVFACDDSE